MLENPSFQFLCQKKLTIISRSILCLTMMTDYRSCVCKLTKADHRIHTLAPKSLLPRERQLAWSDVGIGQNLAPHLELNATVGTQLAWLNCPYISTERHVYQSFSVHQHHRTTDLGARPCNTPSRCAGHGRNPEVTQATDVTQVSETSRCTEHNLYPVITVCTRAPSETGATQTAQRGCGVGFL